MSNRELVRTTGFDSPRHRLYHFECQGICEAKPAAGGITRLTKP